MGKFNAKFVSSEISTIRSITYATEEEPEIYYDDEADYKVEDILDFIKSAGSKMISVKECYYDRENERIAAIQLLESVYPNMKTNPQILEALFEIGGKQLFENIIEDKDLISDNETKLAMYSGAIKGANRRIENIEEKIDNGKINKTLEISQIEELQQHMEQEESWKEEVRIQKNEFLNELAQKTKSNKKIVTKSRYDEKGYDVDGYDRNGYDIDGYDRWGFDFEGYDKEGYDNKGYNREGYNEEGYDQYGYDIEGYNQDGYNKYGHKREDYDRKGYDEEGYDKEGYDKEGYHKISGYNREGYDREGYDWDGYDREGYDINGYDKSGNKRIEQSKPDLSRTEKEEQLAKSMKEEAEIDKILEKIDSLDIMKDSKATDK